MVAHSTHSAGEASPRPRDRSLFFGGLAVALSAANTLWLLAYGILPSLPKTLGASLPAVSGAAIIALSLAVTGAVLGSFAMMLRRQTELSRLLDELDDTGAALLRAEALADSLHRFKAKAAPQGSLI